MNRLTAAVQTIKDSVSARDIGEALGLEIRRGRCKCPIHNGNDFNCVLYGGDRGYYCHVCKAGGDVISFVREYYKLSFKDAVSWINSTFNLGMDIQSPMDPDEAKLAEKLANMRKEKREIIEWKKDAQYGLALGVSKIVQEIEEMRDKNEPASPDAEWNPAFCRALRLLPGAMRLAQDCMFDSFETK